MRRCTVDLLVPPGDEHAHVQARVWAWAIRGWGCEARIREAGTARSGVVFVVNGVRLYDDSYAISFIAACARGEEHCT